ncbi:MAG: isoprenyl transferase [Actinobacteria bacterium]|nr:isoprenyl transferase [Actinomycetota bacterium]
MPGEDFSIEEIKKEGVPKHVAIIMDGNGRWARERKLPRSAGHRAGVRAIRPVVEIATQVGVEYLTLYSFSTENWKRPKREVSFLMRLFEEQLAKEIDELDERGVRIRVIGRLEELPESTRNAFLEAIERTKDNQTLNLNIALNYSGRVEILDAARAICDAIREGRESANFNEEIFSRYMYTSDIPDPELLIRTSGELRISNFLLWQIAYTEIWITRKFWPDFTKSDFLQAIADFKKRERRYGGLNED